jgi:very-short-patch-repair endonuclease
MLTGHLDGRLSFALNVLRAVEPRASWAELPAFLQALCALCTAGERPLLIGLADSHETATVARLACALAIALPDWPLAVCCSPAGWRAAETKLEDRECALLRHGLFWTPDRAEPAEPREELASARALSELGLARERVAILSSWLEVGDRPSAPEQFLWDVLEDLVETAGLFEMHGKLPVPFGPRPMEIDLLCRRRCLAIEVDGWHHFQEPDGYRRDRRKDVLLQEHGYLVLRFLAEDVVDRLEEILSVITRATRRNGGSSCP